MHPYAQFLLVMLFGFSIWLFMPIQPHAEILYIALVYICLMYYVSWTGPRK